MTTTTQLVEALGEIAHQISDEWPEDAAILRDAQRRLTEMEATLAKMRERIDNELTVHAGDVLAQDLYRILAEGTDR